MCKWIIKGWLSLKADYVAESFKYWGITASLIAEYHSELIKIIRDAILPANCTVDQRNEGDDHQDIFVIDDETETPLNQEESDDDADTNASQSNESSINVSSSSSAGDYCSSASLVAQTSASVSSTPASN